MSVVEDFDVAADLECRGNAWSRRLPGQCAGKQRRFLGQSPRWHRRNSHAAQLPRFGAVNGGNCAVAIVPKAADQDTQADTSIDGYAKIAVRIMEV